MKKTAAITVLLYIMLAGTSLWACGDKLLHLSRIHRFHGRLPQATVLIFARPSSLLENASKLRLQKEFREEGYTVLIVKNDRELALALQAGVADAVVADLTDVGGLQRLPSAKRLLIIPVFAKGDRRGEAEARNYPAAIKAPAKAGRFLAAIDRAVYSKQARQNAKLQRVNGSFQ
ncbi:MAG TPA: hypothetical protein VF135_06610 [Terriglobales bacterium]